MVVKLHMHDGFDIVSFKCYLNINIYDDVADIFNYNVYNYIIVSDFIFQKYILCIQGFQEHLIPFSINF